jgi:diguanylate cyclase (GGDEF)-like protein
MIWGLQKLRDSFAARMTAVMILLVTLSIVVMAGLSYWKLYGVTADNANARIERAARTAASILHHAQPTTFLIARHEDGRPLTIQIDPGETDNLLQPSASYDEILAEIAMNNDGAANLFSFDADSRTFFRFATTFRRPDGSLPPAMQFDRTHPAFADLVNGRPFVGIVPVMERGRLAYLTPIMAEGQVVGALAVDVGWVDDLVVARTQLQTLLLLSALGVLATVGALGVAVISREMNPLRSIASFADHVVADQPELTDAGGQASTRQRKDEVGLLAQGISRVAMLQDNLEYLAYTDPLTGKGNRARFFADLEKAVGETRIGTRGWALIQIDINRFSKINDAYGPSAGDKILRYVAAQITLTFGANAKVARTGGDDFSVLLRTTGKAAEVSQLCKDLADRLSVPYWLPQGEIHVRASIGVALLPEDADTAEMAHRHADLARRTAKQDDTIGYAFFSQQMRDASERLNDLEAMLRDALENNELMAYYQPQICVRTGKLMGLEALARWNHPTEGFISPGEFIPVAEKTGLIVELGNWMLNESCRQAKAWLEEGHDVNHVSVNVSPIQLWQHGFVQRVENCLKKHGLPGRYLCLEVTESLFVDQDENQIAAVMADLRALNISLSLDDFGSGYSSLGYLNRLPFDQLKIDRYFVSNAHLDAGKAKLLKGMVSLGKGLGLTIVAEGAEVAEEIALINDTGCDAVQGFYFSRPVPADGLEMALDQIADMDMMNNDPESGSDLKNLQLETRKIA